MAVLEPTTVEFELADVHKVNLCMSFGLLYELKAKHKDLYRRLNSILARDATDALDNLTILYGCCYSVDG